MDYRDRIRITPVERSGHHAFLTSGSPWGDVLGWLASGMSFDDALADYPELTLEGVRACLGLAADRGRGTMIVPPAA